MLDHTAAMFSPTQKSGNFCPDKAPCKCLQEHGYALLQHQFWVADSITCSSWFVVCVTIIFIYEDRGRTTFLLSESLKQSQKNNSWHGPLTIARTGKGQERAASSPVFVLQLGENRRDVSLCRFWERKWKPLTNQHWHYRSTTMQLHIKGMDNFFLSPAVPWSFLICKVTDTVPQRIRTLLP